MASSFVTITIVTMVWINGALASELLYQPINPSFGGNPFNSSHLLARAEAQHRSMGQPRFSSGTIGLSQTDWLVRQLQSRRLGGLAAQLSDAILGAGARNRGDVVSTDRTITFERGVEFIDILIFDAVTNSATNIRVPSLQIDDTGGASLRGLGP